MLKLLARQDGFGLLETIISAGIMTGVMLASVSMMGHLYRANAVGEQRTQLEAVRFTLLQNLKRADCNVVRSLCTADKHDKPVPFMIKGRTEGTPLEVTQAAGSKIGNYTVQAICQNTQGEAQLN